MKGLPFVLCALLLASCARGMGSSPIPYGATGVAPDVAGVAKFAHVFSFKGKDGKEPSASLIDDDGTLYGTTYSGGAHDEGTVFTLTTSGTEHVLHDFKGGSDGALPLAGLTKAHAVFYGTTVNGGGPSGEGIVFKITSSGTERVIHRFGVAGDGANPYARLIDVNGTLYGTTSGGGASSAGTVFTVKGSGKERVLYSFNSADGDGSTPVAGLINVKGKLYGTTQYGGAHCATEGCGAVFSITTSGNEKVLYGFKGGKDGSMPTTALVDVNGTLYGTTAEGGKTNDGTVFKVTTSGKERVLYSFRGDADGAVPQGVIGLKGTLYGTTSQGGASNLGTVFSVTTGGKERVLHTFRGGSDGATPRAALLNVGGTLYGTTAQGGGGKAGTVFRITP